MDVLAHLVVNKLTAALPQLFPGSQHQLFGPVVDHPNVISATVQFEPSMPHMNHAFHSTAQFQLQATHTLQNRHQKLSAEELETHSLLRNWLWVAGGGVVLVGLLFLVVVVGRSAVRRREYTSIREHVL